MDTVRSLPTAVAFYLLSLTLGFSQNLLSDNSLAFDHPDRWLEIESQGFSVFVPPEDLLRGHQKRRIHFSSIISPEVSLRTEAFAEMDRMTQRDPRSSNARLGFIDLTHVQCESGLRGMRADYGWKRGNEIVHTIVKYYFLDQNGKMFKMCAHVYGGKEKRDEYEGYILRGLRQEKTDN